MNKKKAIKLIAGAALSFLLVYILLRFVNISQILGLMKGLSLTLLLLSLIFYGLTYLFRALRFFFLLKNKVNLSDLFAIVSIHSMMNNLLPFRTGELSYIYLVRKNGVELNEAISTLTIARIGDFIVIPVIFLLIIPFISIKQGVASQIILFAVAILLLSVILTIVLVLYSKRILLWIRRGAAKKKRFSLELFNELEKIFGGFEKLKSPRNLGVIVFYSTLISLGQYVMYYFLMKSMGINIGFFTIIVAISIYCFLVYLPIQGLAGIGSYEGSWAISFLAVGLNNELAISSGFGQHILITFFFLILALFGFFYLKKRKAQDTFINDEGSLKKMEGSKREPVSFFKKRGRKYRKRAFYLFHRKEYYDSIRKREGVCKKCGKCCAEAFFGFRCPFLKRDNLCRLHKYKKYLPLFCGRDPVWHKKYYPDRFPEGCGFYWGEWADEKEKNNISTDKRKGGIP